MLSTQFIRKSERALIGPLLPAANVSSAHNSEIYATQPSIKRPSLKNHHLPTRLDIMKYIMTLSLIVLGTTRAFVPSAPQMRGTAKQAKKRFASTWLNPKLKRQVASSNLQARGFLNMNFLSDMFYDLRSNSLGFASKVEIKAAASNPNAVFLDVRSQAEIDAASLEVDKPVIYATCASADACPALTKLPKKKETPVIVFCASGKRASVAKQVLESKGYTSVLNAGGLGDLDYL